MVVNVFLPTLSAPFTSRERRLFPNGRCSPTGNGDKDILFTPTRKDIFRKLGSSERETTIACIGRVRLMDIVK